jgi:tripartite ATP-independent transporter DctP family solute receptor
MEDFMKARIVLLAAVLTICFCLPLQAAENIKLGVVTKPGSAQNVVADKFKELLEAKSNGDWTVTIYDSGVLGNETEMLQQIQMNTLHIGIITGGPFDTFTPIVRVINYPFLFKDNAQADEILDGPLGQEILDGLEPMGFKGLCFSENGFRNLTNSKRAVKTPEDLKGLKIRVMNSALHKTIWRALGANPTPMAWPIYTELQQGVIDGQENPLWVMEVYKFYEIQDYMTMTRHVYSPHIDVASLKWWQNLDAKDQALIAGCMKDAAKFQRKDNREKDAARIKLLQEKGMQIEMHPDVDAFRQKVASLAGSDMFKDPAVHDLLVKMLEAVK